jgi:hypothetical protein
VGAGAVLGVVVASPKVTVNVATAGAGVPDSTAAQILAAILAEPTALAILTPTLAFGSTGVGKTTALSEQVLTKDGYRFRYTSDGNEWSAWSPWIAIIKTTGQPLIDAMTVAFDDDDIAAAGDKFYFASHYRHMLRFNLPKMGYDDLVKLTYNGSARSGSIPLTHMSAVVADRPEVVVWNGDSSAYV